MKINEANAMKNEIKAINVTSKQKWDNEIKKQK